MDTSENLKNQLDPRLASALFYLQIHCKKNSTRIGFKYLKSESGKIVAIFKGDNGTYGSIGLDKENELKIYVEDKKFKNWAIMEGFTEDQMYNEMEDKMIKESSIIQLAKELVK